MGYSNEWVSRLKTNPIIDAIVFVLVLAVIGVSAYMAHDARITVMDQQAASRLYMLEQREALRLSQIAQAEALKASQGLAERQWRMFFRDNPEAIVPRRFFNRETIEEIEAANEMISPPSPNGVLPKIEAIEP